MGLTFDTGALIGLERSRHQMRKVFDVAVTHDVERDDGGATRGAGRTAKSRGS